VFAAQIVQEVIRSFNRLRRPCLRFSRDHSFGHNLAVRIRNDHSDFRTAKIHACEQT
jgi:hypothetical protein